MRSVADASASSPSLRGACRSGADGGIAHAEVALEILHVSARTQEHEEHVALIGVERAERAGFEEPGELGVAFADSPDA